MYLLRSSLFSDVRQSLPDVRRIDRMTLAPFFSGASKEISSSSRSMIVWSLRAPMFSVRSFTSCRYAGDLLDARRSRSPA